MLSACDVTDAPHISTQNAVAYDEVHEIEFVGRYALHHRHDVIRVRDFSAAVTASTVLPVNTIRRLSFLRLREDSFPRHSLLVFKRFLQQKLCVNSRPDNVNMQYVL